MSRNQWHRDFRITQGTNDSPFIVRGRDLEYPDEWIEIARFDSQDKARDYIIDTQARQMDVL